MYVSPKKSFGQHFLKNDSISQAIADGLTGYMNYKNVLEVGPGTGALTKFLLAKTDYTVYCVEAEREALEYMNLQYPELSGRIFAGDFLNFNLSELMNNQSFGLIGNYPYNISSQILFKALDFKDFIPEIVGMFQKEVAVRVTSGPGNKDYGILSIFMKAFYEPEYLFTVEAHEFIPPPKVKSGVIRFRRNALATLPCDENLFRQVVKTGFNQRRKQLRNSLKPLFKGSNFDHPILTKRPEQLYVEEFVMLTNVIQNL